mmetsp:Transcript_3831/g.5622  ORF Transcript_3831/g.5622 Transcript_3831/m.5622 type:complete len:249 (-) Transcript_3831:30-776(-)
MAVCSLQPFASLFSAQDSCVTSFQVILQVLVLAFSCWSFYLFKLKYWDTSVLSTSKDVLVYIFVTAVFHSLLVAIEWAVMISSVCYRKRYASNDTWLEHSTPEERARLTPDVRRQMEHRPRLRRQQRKELTRQLAPLLIMIVVGLCVTSVWSVYGLVVTFQSAATTHTDSLSIYGTGLAWCGMFLLQVCSFLIILQVVCCCAGSCNCCMRFLAKLGIGSERPVFKKDEPDDEEAGYRSTQTRSRRSSY